MKQLQKSLSLQPDELNFANGIPIFFMSIQIELSQLLDKVQNIGAGILTLNDIINVNRKTNLDEVKSFFQVMEVYGQSPDLYISRGEFSSESSSLDRNNSDSGSDFDKLELLRRMSLR